MQSNAIKEGCKTITTRKWFEWFITAIILINSVLIGVETYVKSPTISAIQHVILGIFTIEIILRFIAADGVKDFFSYGWNIFDLSLVLIGYIPENLFANASTVMVLRVLRVFRVLRLLRAAIELKVIITVLVKSMTAMFYNVILFVIFIYLFAIAGVGLFKLPDPNQMDSAEKANYEAFIAAAPNAPANSPDPYGTLGEASFTLFRALTGEDWTDLRYNLNTAYEYGLVKTSPAVITLFHVLWFVLAAFLLLNLVTGAILNNYQNVMDTRATLKYSVQTDKQNNTN